MYYVRSSYVIIGKFLDRKCHMIIIHEFSTLSQLNDLINYQYHSKYAKVCLICFNLYRIPVNLFELLFAQRGENYRKIFTFKAHYLYQYQLCLVSIVRAFNVPLCVSYILYMYFFVFSFPSL